MRARPRIEDYPMVATAEVGYYNEDGIYYVSALEQWAEEAEQENKELKDKLKNEFNNGYEAAKKDITSMIKKELNQ